jgi:molybdenum cofactor cytidylyltransferase
VTGIPETQPNIAAVVLAAGGSTRMGQPKLLLPVRGKPMVRHAAEAACAAGLAQTVVVVGADAAAVAQALAGLPVDLVVNQAWSEGLSTSLRAGLDALRPDTHAALLILADQPGLSTELICRLVDCYRAGRARLVAPFYGERRGHPVLFDRTLFDELRAAKGDSGGREVVASYAAEMERVEIQDAAVLDDIDTWADYQRALSESDSAPLARE